MSTWECCPFCRDFPDPPYCHGINLAMMRLKCGPVRPFISHLKLIRNTLSHPSSTESPQGLDTKSLTPTYSSGNQNTTSLSPVASMLNRGFHSHTATRPLHGNDAIGLSNFRSPSSTTVPCVSHTIASWSPPDPPTR